MRKLINLLAFAVVLFLASCGSKGKYTVTGTVEDSYDGDKVYILESTNDNFTPVDSVVISNGKFVFKGEMGDTPVLRFLAWTDGENDPIYVDFFQEPGAITIKLAFDPSASKISGTETNDAYQNFRDQIAEIDLKRMHIFQAYTASDATEEQKAKSIADMDVETAKWMDAIKNSISDHIQSPLSVLLINRYHTQMSNQEVDSYLSLLSTSQLADSGIKEINEKLEVPRKTFVGKIFTDLEMLTPEGNPIKLSDYAGKGKVVLIDFWASWCGPCLREMPRLVDAYAKYKDKGFEIIGVSFDRDGEAWKKGIEELNITWPQMSDLKYWDSEGAKVYAVRSIPHVILLDGEGTIVSRGLHGDALQAKIAELMGE